MCVIAERISELLRNHVSSLASVAALGKVSFHLDPHLLCHVLCPGIFKVAACLARRCFSHITPLAFGHGLFHEMSSCLVVLDRSAGLGRTWLFHPWGRELEGEWSRACVPCHTLSDPVTG